MVAARQALLSSDNFYSDLNYQWMHIFYLTFMRFVLFHLNEAKKNLCQFAVARLTLFPDWPYFLAPTLKVFIAFSKFILNITFSLSNNVFIFWPELSEYYGRFKIHMIYFPSELFPLAAFLEALKSTKTPKGLIISNIDSVIMVAFMKESYHLVLKIHLKSD